MIKKFSTVYAGHTDLGDLGQHATPVHERRYPNEHLATVFDKTVAIAQACDRLGFDTLWLAEHHFQPEGYECNPNIPMAAVHLAHLTSKIKIGCGFNVLPTWHPLRVAEDFAVADILTKGRTVFGVARGYHAREVETFGVPLHDSDANREYFEEQVDVVMKAFHSESFSHRGKHFTIPPAIEYRGEELKEITLVPRPLRQPVETWQPVVSASQRGLDFMFKHGMKGLIGGAAVSDSTDNAIRAFRDTAHRHGLDWELGEGLSLGITLHLADSREQAIQELTPYYEEHVKLFGPLGFMRELSPEQLEVTKGRGGWDAAGIPTCKDFVDRGAWFAGTTDEIVAVLRDLEQRYPGLENVHLSSPLTTPQTVVIEQLEAIAAEVMPQFNTVSVG